MQGKYVVRMIAGSVVSYCMAITASGTWTEAKPITSGNIEATPAAQKVLERPRRPHMDLAFCIDTTGSMQQEINLVKEKVRSLVAKLCSGKPSPVVRVGLVAYRDNTDDYVTKVYDFTDDIDQFVKDISELEASGGGDAPEAVSTAIKTAVKELSWDESKKTAKLLFLIGDAGPHPEEREDDWSSECKKAISRGIQINTIGCDGLEGFPEDRGTGFFKKVAKLTDGNFELLAYKHVVTKSDGTTSTFIRSGGAAYEVSSTASSEWKKGAKALTAAGKAKYVSAPAAGSYRGSYRASMAGASSGLARGGLMRSRTLTGASRKESNLDSIMYGAALKKSRESLGVDYEK